LTFDKRLLIFFKILFLMPWPAPALAQAKGRLFGAKNISEPDFHPR
jgi:hypothetical protein